MPRNSVELQASINAQLERINKDSDGNYLCRKCGSVVPDDFKFVFFLPGDESRVWGPCCSEECICYTKICTGCNKDFNVDDESQIKYFDNGNWFCSECSQNIVSWCVRSVKKDTTSSVADVISGILSLII
jgi:hypothetical protein